MRSLTFLAISSMLFSFGSCTLSEENDASSKNVYFDIQGFFEREISRLSRESPHIYKEVKKNEQKEGKVITINDWGKELALFIESDINKPAWRSGYKADIKDDTTIYIALMDDLRVRRIRIVKSGDKVASIEIENKDSNKLYESNELLYYYPDSLYIIRKNQDVRIIGNNNYQITGDFIKE